AAQREAVAALSERAAAVDPAASHPFAPCDRQGWTAAADEALAEALDGAGRALDEAEAAGKRACEALRVPLPERTEALAALCALGKSVGLGPVPEAAILGSATASGWSAASARATAFIARERRSRARRADLLERRKESFLLEVDHAGEIDRFRRRLASFFLVRL